MRLFHGLPFDTELLHLRLSLLLVTLLKDFRDHGCGGGLTLVFSSRRRWLSGGYKGYSDLTLRAPRAIPE